MNRARRARQRFNERRAGGHTGMDHVPGQPCTTCRPLAKTPEQRTADAAWRAQQQDRERAIRGPLSIPLARITELMGKVRNVPGPGQRRRTGHTRIRKGARG